MAIESNSSAARGELQDALTDLGFSAYEAKCYVGLVGTKGLTGYGVSKATSVPQPKVYETLRRLVRRGAARQVSDEPAVFVATPPSKLLELLESEFRGRHALAAQAAIGLDHDDEGSDVVIGTSLSTRETLTAAARTLIGSASGDVTISASSRVLAELADDLRRAEDRGVDVVLVPTASAEGLALVVDSREALTAATNGHDWTGMRSGSLSFVAAIEGAIRLSHVGLAPPTGMGRGTPKLDHR